MQYKQLFGSVTGILPSVIATTSQPQFVIMTRAIFHGRDNKT